MSVKYDGYNTNCLTMVNYNAKVGYPISVDTKGRACNAELGKPFIGICVSVRGDTAVIQTHGYMEAKYSQKPGYGVFGVTAGAGGTINTAEFATAGRAALIVDIDEVNNTVGFIL